jgi:hypothetical protein
MLLIFEWRSLCRHWMQYAYIIHVSLEIQIVLSKTNDPNLRNFISYFTLAFLNFLIKYRERDDTIRILCQINYFVARSATSILSLTVP